MNVLERTVLDAFRRILIPGHTFGVALSGGADSVALLVAAARLHAECPDEVGPCIALHCNFGLRGDESDGDEAYCRQLCEQIGVPLEVARFDAAVSKRPGQSIEMVCRDLRYDWFREKTKEFELSTVAVAHHHEDAIETMLINLLRGTGPLGLCGLSENRGPISRPMLNLTRPEIEAYLAELDIPFRTDSSNHANDYRRNAIRNVILPEIRRYFPAADQGLENTRKTMIHSQNAIDDYVRILRHTYCDGHDVDIESIRICEDDPEGVLYLIGKFIAGPTGLSMPTIEAILSAEGPESRFFYSADGSRRFCLHRGTLSPVPVHEPVEEQVSLANPGPHFSVEHLTPEQFADIRRQKAFKANELYLDAAILDSHPELTCRTWRPGDRLKPFGMNGTRLVSDILSDLHLSVAEKECVRVLSTGDDLLWVVGIRTSRLYAVTPSTTLILRLTAL